MISWLKASAREPARDPDAGDAARAASGDHEAFEALVCRHEQAVFALALRMLGNRDDALDAVQEAFLRAYRGLPRFRGEATFRSWLWGITLNACRNRIASAPSRAALRSTSVDAGEAGDRPLELVDDAPGPERSAYGSELGAALAGALRRLSGEHREVILLREMQGLEYDEIAEVLACATGTVKSRLARARAALRAELEGVWP